MEPNSSPTDEMRKERIRTHVYSYLDALKQDFNLLDILTMAFNRAQIKYRFEKEENPDSPYLIKIKVAIEDLSFLVHAKEKEMIKHYNSNTFLDRPISIDELRAALEYHLGQQSI